MEETGNPTNNLKKYLQILDRSSSIFKAEIEEFRAKHLKEREVTLETAKNVPNSATEALMAKFFIPITSQNKEYVLSYIFYNEPVSKYTVGYFLDIPKNHKIETAITSPTILVQITENISIKEWKEIWDKRIKKNHSTIEMEKPTDSIKSLKHSSALLREWGNIDLLLEIYHLFKEENYSISRISTAIPEIKRKLGVKKLTCYTTEETRRLLKQISSQINSL